MGHIAIVGAHPLALYVFFVVHRVIRVESQNQPRRLLLARRRQLFVLTAIMAFHLRNIFLQNLHSCLQAYGQNASYHIVTENVGGV
jgi:hypothetical protein